MITRTQYTTELPRTTFKTICFASCPYCGRADFRHVMHRRNHLAKCQAEAYADMAAHAVLDCEDEGLADMLPASIVCAAAPHVFLTVACQGDADLYAENAVKAAERRARYGVQRWAEEI